MENAQVFSNWVTIILHLEVSASSETSCLEYSVWLWSLLRITTCKISFDVLSTYTNRHTCNFKLKQLNVKKCLFNTPCKSFYPYQRGVREIERSNMLDRGVSIEAGSLSSKRIPSCPYSIKYVRRSIKKILKGRRRQRTWFGTIFVIFIASFASDLVLGVSLHVCSNNSRR